MAKELPEDFVLYTEWPEFRAVEMTPQWVCPEYVGINPRGLRRGFWPLYAESYVSDIEPCTALAGPGRLVMWQRLNRTSIPPGWKANGLALFLDDKGSCREGFTRIYQDGTHFDNWAPTERARRKRWINQSLDKEYIILTVSVDVFWNAYKTSATWRKIEFFYRMMLHKQLILWADRSLTCRVVKNSNTGDIVAGMATLDSLECRGSYYFIGFLCESGKKDHAMTGLMNDWFENSTRKGIKYIYFGQFWDKDSPHNWKGFSDFKAKFTTDYIDFPPLLVKWVRKTKRT